MGVTLELDSARRKLADLPDEAPNLGVVTGAIDAAAAALGLGAAALCLQPPGLGRTRRPGRLPRFGDGQPVAQPCFQTIERYLTVAGL